MQGGSGGAGGGYGRGQNYYGGGGGGGQGQYYHNRPPPRQFNQGNFQNNNQYRQFNNQHRGSNSNNQNQFGYGNQREGDRQIGSSNNVQFRSISAESGNPMAGGKDKHTMKFVAKPAATSSGGVSPAAPKDVAAANGAEGSLTKLQCFRCYNHGLHNTKECKEDVLCVNCTKVSHISSKCAWLHQKKPVATFVGFGGEGLGCFVAEHTKETDAGQKGNATALIKIKDGSAGNATAEKLELGLGSTYPWRWGWKAKEVAAGAFLVNFPTVAKINEAEIYDWVPLKKVDLMVNIKLWTDESLAAGKLTTVWVKAKGVPKTLKNFHGLCEVGSTLGQYIEADMENLMKTGQVRLKIGVVDHLKIPKWTQISTPRLHYYRIYFQLEEIVELGWERPEEEFLQDFEDVMDSQPEIVLDGGGKRQKNGDQVAPPSGQMVDQDRNIMASTKTRIALEEREQNLKEQDEEDVRLNLLRTGKSLFSSETLVRDPVLFEKTGDTDMVGEGNVRSEEERVRLSDDEQEGEFDASQSVSFGAQVRAIGNEGNQVDKEGADSQGTVDDHGPRYSDRLASKNPADVSVLDRARNIKAKAMEKEEGVGGRKNGTANGRKATGAGRG